MSEVTTEYAVTEEQMQKLADADAVLADLAIGAMLAGDMEAFDRISSVGLPLYEFQQELVDQGLAKERLDRSDRDEAADE